MNSTYLLRVKGKRKKRKTESKKINRLRTSEKFMQNLGTSSLIAEADSVFCHLIMFLTVFLHWIYEMKYSCRQDFLLSLAGFLLDFWLRNVPLDKK